MNVTSRGHRLCQTVEDKTSNKNQAVSRLRSQSCCLPVKAMTHTVKLGQHLLALDDHKLRVLFLTDWVLKNITVKRLKDFVKIDGFKPEACIA